MIQRHCFLRFFVGILACLIGAFFATLYGVPQRIWQLDLSHMTTVNAAFFVATLVYLGRVSWKVHDGHDIKPLLQKNHKQIEWGWFASAFAPIVGLLGTVWGLSLQSDVLAGGTLGLAPLSTSLFSTLVGLGSCALILLFTWNLKVGIDHAEEA